MFLHAWCTPADLDIHRFGQAGSHSVKWSRIKPATQEHRDLLSPTDRWKFPAIQRTPTHSALLQPIFFWGTHTEMPCCLTMCINVYGRAGTSFWQRRPHTLISRIYRDTERKNRVSITWPARIINETQQIPCLFSLFWTNSSWVQTHYHQCSGL